MVIDLYSYSLRHLGANVLCGEGIDQLKQRIAIQFPIQFQGNQAALKPVKILIDLSEYD